MSDLKILPISCVSHEQLAPMMDQEEQAWFAELRWDYAPIRAILHSFVSQNLLPGYVALEGNRAAGYGYFLINRNKGIIGTIYAPQSASQQEVADEILSAAVEALRMTNNVRRIEAQIIPFHGLNLTAGFRRHGFQHYPRYYLEKDLRTYSPPRATASSNRIVFWGASRLRLAAEVALKSYQNTADALISQDYTTLAGCENYLRSLTENPGCGIFMPEASYVGLDDGGYPCGFIISSRISSFSGMIPQIAILPSHQGRGLGSALMHHALAQFKELGIQTVSLTVTKENRRARDWYQRVGFRIRKEFGAYFWERP